MSEQKMWRQYVKEHPEAEGAIHSAWAFSSVPDKLAGLVLDGIKVATCSPYDLYEEEEEELPKEGEYSTILDSKGQELCIICTTKVTVVPFGKVTKEHAFKEGEGDRSLTYWREVHMPIHKAIYEEMGKEFNEECKVVCEEFKVVYRP